MYQVVTGKQLMKLNTPVEEMPSRAGEGISSIFNKGNLIHFSTKNQHFRASMEDKKVASGNYYGKALDQRYRMIHSFLFQDTLVNKEIKLTEKVDLKGYETENLEVADVDFCESKLLIACYSKSSDKYKTKWDSSLEMEFPTYLFFDLQNNCHQFIKLSEIVYDEDKVYSSAGAVLIDSDKILIAYRYEKEKCRALIYNLNSKRVIEEYELKPQDTIANRVGNCLVSPDGKFLLYNESSQTPTDLFLYDLEKRKEYTIVSNEIGNLYSFYNWDSEDEFFYGVYSMEKGENTVFLKQAGEVK